MKEQIYDNKMYSNYYPSKQNNSTSFQQVSINLNIGKYFCAPTKTHFQECRLSANQQPPSMEISVDYGDGTHQTWFQDSPRNIWVHYYVLPGTYTIAMKGRNPNPKYENVFNIYGTWRRVKFEKLMMKIYDFIYSNKSFSHPV